MPSLPDDMFAPDVLSDPYEFYARLREQDPVHWAEKYRTWLVTRYDDVSGLLRSPELFSSEYYARDSARPPAPPIDAGDAQFADYVVEFRSREFIQNDPPEHTRMRSVLQAYFSSRSMEQWRVVVSGAISSILDEVAGRGWMDLQAALARPLPFLIISRMLGIPDPDRGVLAEQAERRMRSALSLAPNRMRVAASGIRESQEYLSQQLESREGHINDDLLGLLMEAELLGTYTRGEVLANALSLLDAGYETTIQLICNGTLALLRNPEQWEQLKSDPAALARSATDECLRYDPPIPALRRVASGTVTMRGKAIQGGDRVTLVVASANRDPGVFADPERFNIRRTPNRHLSFGFGIHRCLGQYLAQMEGQEVFKSLAQRMPDLALASQQIDYATLRGVRSVTSLPVSWAA